MKNKQKAWRTAARSINLEEGRKHRGRAFKSNFSHMKNSGYPLLNKLLAQYPPVEASMPNE